MTIFLINQKNHKRSNKSLKQLPIILVNRVIHLYFNTTKDTIFLNTSQTSRSGLYTPG